MSAGGHFTLVEGAEGEGWTCADELVNGGITIVTSNSTAQGNVADCY